MIPKRILDFGPKWKDLGITGRDGVCINCGVATWGANYAPGISDSMFHSVLVLVLHGYIRSFEIDCGCGSHVGFSLEDLEEYRGWDYSCEFCRQPGDVCGHGK